MESILTIYSPLNEQRYVVLQDPDTDETKWFAVGAYGVLIEIPPPENPYERTAP